MISDDPTIVDMPSGHQPIRFGDTDSGRVGHIPWFDQDDEDLGLGLSGSGSGEGGDEEDNTGDEVINVTVNTDGKGILIIQTV